MNPELELIHRIAAGEEAALKRLYDLYFPRLSRFLLRVTRDPDHIVEIVNDVFFVIWRNARGFRENSSVSTWVLGIAYKRGLKHMSRHGNASADVDINNVAQDAEETFHDERNAQQLFALLSADQRAVMELTYFFGYSYKEISEIIECPENTVKTRMFHARKKLRALVEKHTHV